jgi:LytS/YehU family sensor histidine kinase
MFIDVRAADAMISRLSDLLRLALDNERTQEITLNGELEFLDAYLQIEKIRFKDRLEVQVDSDSSALDARVPHLILQPLVENAIRHGTSKRSENGVVLIRSFREHSRLYLVVRDNGPGFSDVLKNCHGDGHGLTITRERLKTLYGNAQRLTMRNLPEGGAEVCVDIPFWPMI